jgi:hypothetical protein
MGDAVRLIRGQADTRHDTKLCKRCSKRIRSCAPVTIGQADIRVRHPPSEIQNAENAFLLNDYR